MEQRSENVAANEPNTGGIAESVVRQNESRPLSRVPANEGFDGFSVTACLSAYYTDARIQPAAFLKAVRAEKVKGFKAEDVSRSVQHLEKTDPVLARTIALLGRGPDAVARWVVEATKFSLKLYLPHAASEAGDTAKQLFDRVVRMSADDLDSKDKRRRTRAQNLLRLVLAWLTTEGNLKPTDGLMSIGSIAKKKNVGLLLSRVTFNQLEDLSLIASLFESVVAQGSRERQSILSELDKLRDRAVARETELQMTRGNLKEAVEERTRLSSELSSAKKKLHDEKELRCLDATQQRGRMRAFLAERLNLPLSNARDALDLDPPYIEAVRQRIEMAITAIDDEMGESCE